MKRSMKVTLVGPVYPYRGGIAAFSTALSRELTGAGLQVQTISFKRQYPLWLYPGGSDRDPSLLHDQVDAVYTLDPLSVWSWWSTARQIIRYQPDLVIIQWWTTFWAPAFSFLSAMLNRRRIPCVFCVHNVVPHENRFYDRWLSRLALSRGKAFITLSPKENQRLVTLFPSAKTFASRLPVPKVMQTGSDQKQARSALGIDPEQQVLLFFGIIRPYKGLSVLVEALRILKEKNQRPFLIVAGEFWEDAQGYQQQIEQNGLAGQVMLLNRWVPNEELGKIFSAADIFVAPYIHGTQSAAIKTAMSYRLPILASDQISGDLDAQNYPVYVHQAGDAADLANSIQNFFCLPESRQVGALQEDNSWDQLVTLVQEIRKHLSLTI